MAFKHFVLTIPNPAAAVRLSSVLPDGLPHFVPAPAKSGQYDVCHIQLTFELISGTGVFIGSSSDVSSTNAAAKVTTSKTYEIQGGAVRLGDLWVIGTAGDVLAIGALDL